MNNYMKGDIYIDKDYGTWYGNRYGYNDNDATISGTRGNDTMIFVQASYNTVYAGAGDDKITLSSGSNNNVIYAEGGNDFIGTKFTRNPTIYGGKGNDTIRAASDKVFADGGDDNDLLIPLDSAKDVTMSGGAGDDTFWFIESSTVTASGGAGKDVYRFDPYYLFGPYRNDVVITDISTEDVIRCDVDEYDGSELVYTYENGNIVLRDTESGLGLFNVTLQGITDINQVADLTYRSVGRTATLGEIFSLSSGASSTTETPASSTTETSASSTTETPASSTTETPASSTTETPASSTTETPATQQSSTSVTNTTTNTTTNTINTTNITNNNYFFGIPLASNMFSFLGGMSNTIQRFITGRSSRANVLVFGTALASLSRYSSYMTFNSVDGSVLRVNNSSSVNEAIQYSTDGRNISYAKVGYAEQSNSFTYEDGVNFYSGGSYTDVLQITSYQSRNIWLDGSAGVSYSGINNINAASSTGNNTLAGDGGNNQITAGSGNDSLWGGSGSSEDILIGGSGTNMFWYGKGDGNDQVQKSKTGDVINLYDVTLADITSANFTGSAISVGFNTGFNLNVNVSSNLSSTFRLADGSNWQYNKSAGSWQFA